MQHLFQVTGMSCGHCERAVKQAVQKLDPQAQVKVNLASGQVEVESAQPRALLAQTIADEGYNVAA